MYLFADISEHQGYAGSSKPAPDFAAYKAAGFRHISQRVFSGWREDYSAGRNVLEAKRLGIPQMWYVWIAPQNPVTTAAPALKRVLDRMVALVGKPELGIMLDVEDTANTLSPGTYAAYVAVIEQVCQPYGSISIYTAAWYWSKHLRGQTQWQTRPIITASYPFQSNTGQNLVPFPASFSEYGNWAFQRGDRGQAGMPVEWGGRPWSGWQFTSIAKVPGFVGNVDLNLIRPSWFDALLANVQPSPGQVDPIPVPDIPDVPPPSVTFEVEMPDYIATDPGGNLYSVSPGGVKPITGWELANVPAYRDAGAPLAPDQATLERIATFLHTGRWALPDGSVPAPQPVTATAVVDTAAIISGVVAGVTPKIPTTFKAV